MSMFWSSESSLMDILSSSGWFSEEKTTMLIQLLSTFGAMFLLWLLHYILFRPLNRIRVSSCPEFICGLHSQISKCVTGSVRDWVQGSCETGSLRTDQVSAGQRSEAEQENRRRTARLPERMVCIVRIGRR